MFVTARTNYLLAHVIMEGWSILVAFTIYMMAIKTYRFSADNFLFFLGHAYLAVAAIDFAHTLAYKGMGVFPLESADVSTQLWISARYLEGLALLVSPYFAKKKFRSIELFMIFFIAVSLVFLSIMKFGIFPSCFIEGQGLTPFKVASEYIIMAILVGALVRLKGQRETVSPCVRKALAWSIIFTIFSELSFTLYSDVYGLANLVGHIFKVLSFYLIYEGVISRGLDEPFEGIFRRLRNVSVTDPLTLLYNRLGFNEMSEKMLNMARREGNVLGMMMIDLDNFKEINDNFGHIQGDEVLLRVGEIIQRNVRAADLAARIGGDEFAVVLSNTDPEGVRIVQERIEKDFSSWLHSTDHSAVLGISIGSALEDFRGNPPTSLDDLLSQADRAMYRQKTLHRNGNIPRFKAEGQQLSLSRGLNFCE